MNLSKIISLIELSPSGYKDPKALEKYAKERVELSEATNRAERLEETVDCFYYLLKEMVNLEGEFTFQEIITACEVKYEMRFVINSFCKDKIAERIAMLKSIEKGI